MSAASTSGATTTPAPVDAGTDETLSGASNPAGSAWVSANAGSGKTYVLVRRVVRLLLAGTDPARILCLTFTKAAAAEMAKRVFAELGQWTLLSDGVLADAIAGIEGRPPDALLIAEARRLFGRALETPGGLKIQTIHAFCERLLHQFPFEANVAGHFEVLDERDAKALSDEARRSVLARASAEPDGVLGNALRAVLALASDANHEESVAQFIDKRDQIGAWVRTAGSLDAAIAEMRRALGLSADETVAGLRREVLAGAPLDAGAAGRLVALLSKGGVNDTGAAERLRRYTEAADDDHRIDAWLDFFRAANGDFRSASKMVSNDTKKAWPGLGDLLAAESDRLQALLDRIRTAELFESSAAMLRLADGAIGAYQRLKQVRGVLDFDDLIVKTAALLARSDAARWVQYKLDRGLDHILVDEAQDTSPRQWQVIQALAEEFFVGEGASQTTRTVFAVGDEKQSIYSFQGAVPAWFTGVQRTLGARAKAASYVWADLELHLSFRSVPVVIDAVDEVFKSEAAYKGLSTDPVPPAHQARRRGEPGRVVIWPAIAPPDKPEAEDWATPLDHLGDQSPEVRLAKRIATTIRNWLKSGETIAAIGKPIRPGGILILVRSRGALTDAINRALKTQGVPIAGTDRLTLTEHIAVMDLMALGRVVLLPEDDLSLAAVLKSPLIGLDEDALYDLARGRTGSLWDALATMATDRDDIAAARARLEAWRRLADYRDPHAFFAAILGPDGRRRAFLGRLGPEAEDVLDEFLSEALAYERTNIPSLEGFLDWLVAGETEIRRDTETGRDEVRVMTVHGAKGLEADVVFLVDNGSRPFIAAHDPRMLPLAEDPDPLSPGPVVWMRTIKAMPKRVRNRLEAWRTRAEEEYRRLLYVGMTRPRDRLYVVGISNRNTDKDEGWHALVTKALEPECTQIGSPDGDSDELEWRHDPLAAAAASVGEAASATKIDLPEWATRDAPPAPAAPRRLTPSTVLAAADGGPPDFGPKRLLAACRDGEAATALLRGRLIHRLLQSLPDLDPADRQATGARYLAAVAPHLSLAERAEIMSEVVAVLDEPKFAAVFAPGSRAEVGIVARVGRASGEVTIAGRVDRLAVTANRVLIVDYKTNRPAPDRLSEVPVEYVAQLALYRVVLRRLYPDHAVAVALLWTDRPAIMDIPDATLDSAESSIFSP